MKDTFENYSPSLTGPATGLVPIEPNDGEDLERYVRGVSVATSGLVRVTAVDDSVATIFIAAGAPFPVRVKRVWLTGTEATGIVGLL